MKLKTALITLLVIAFLGAIGVSAYLIKGMGKPKEKVPLQPSPTASPRPSVDTSSWKTYHNKKYGFELRYPSDWKVTEDFAQAVVNISFAGPALDKTPGIEDNFLIQIYDLGKALNLREWMENFYLQNKNVTFEDTTINGYPAVVAYASEYTTPGSMVAILRKDLVFSFPIPSEENKAIFSTFKFIE